MSPADPHLPEAEGAGHSSDGLQAQSSYKSTGDVYAHTIRDGFYTTDDHGSQKSLHKMDAPTLPQKSSLRASRLMDNMSVKSGVSGKTPELSQATLHDVYLSSEEDASSSADDFSDYDWDSGTDDTEDAQSSSPRRDSHEAKARVVSVVFMGKPSIIDLPSHRRSMSPNSIEARRRASTVSSMSPPHSAAPSLHTSTNQPESSSSSIHQQSSPRKSSLVSSLISRKKPLFLNIDPYANGSSYSLDTTTLSHPSGHDDDESPIKTPRTPTFLKNMSRTMSLVRKKSRPMLNMLNNADASTASAPSIIHDGEVSSPVPQRSVTEPVRPVAELPQPPPSPTVTYKDILKAANRNSMMIPHHLQFSPIAEEHTPITPSSPSHPHKRGILSGLTSRRKSIKWTERLI